MKHSLSNIPHPLIINTLSFRAIQLSVWVIACGATVSTYGEGDGHPPVAALDEIVVVASKRGVSRADYPGSVTILDRDVLNGIQAPGTVDITEWVPGLFAQETGARNPTPVIMRGININGMSDNNLGGDTYTVASYFNNIPLQGYYVPPQVVLKDIDSVDILRGPQGTLYGASSLSGLIAYHTAKPVEDSFSLSLHTGVSQSAGSRDLSFDNDVVINTPVVPDLLTLRLLISATENAGFIDNDVLFSGPAADINDDRVNAARLSLLLTPSERFSVSLMHQNQHATSGDVQADNLPVSGRPYVSTTYYLQPMSGDLDLTDLVLKYRFDDFSIEASTNLYAYELVQRTDITAFYRYLGFTVPVEGGDSGFNDARVDVDQKSAELRLQTHVDSDVNGLIGISVTDNTVDFLSEDYLTDYASHTQLKDYTITQDQALSDVAVFSEVTWQLSHDLALTLGGRYFDYRDTIQTCDAFSTDPLFCLSQRVEDDHSSFKLAALYQLGDDIAAFSSVSEGFRRGGANAVPQDLINHRTYSPDTTVNYELGFTGSTYGAHLDYAVTMFHIDWSDTQLFTGNESSELGYYVSYIANAEDAFSQGLEVELHWSVTPSLELQSYYAYSRAKLTQDAPSYNDDSGFGDNGYKGDRLPGAPKTQFHLALFYSQPWEGFVIDSSIVSHYTGPINTQLNAEHGGFRTIGGHTIFNMVAGVSQNQWRLGLFVDNVGNKRAVTATQPGFYGPESAVDFVVRPRTMGLDARYFLN